jgi:hypothetical protein
MAGYKHIIWIEELKAKCDSMGFRIGYPEHGYYVKEYADVVSIFPKDRDALPIYSRDAELFTGTIESLKMWLNGIEWAREYDRMTIGNSIDERRARNEQDWRNMALVKILTEE